MDDEYYCFCEGSDCDQCAEGDCPDCDTCWEANMHDCSEAGCYGDNPNAHIEIFGTYAPGSDFDDYYNS